MKICVIGAGVVGLTTALELQKNYRNADITVVADKFRTATTSDVAAGLFRPATSFTGPTEDITRRWIKDAYDYWDIIRKSEEAPLAGVCQLSGYIYSSTSKSIVRNEYLEKVLPIYRAATKEELTLCPGDWKYGSFFQTVLTECRYYLPWAETRFLRTRGIITEQKIESIPQLHGLYDVVVNCSGLGAKELCGDKKLVPLRGQVIKVKAPWLKTAFYGDFDTYIIPGFDGVTLGGCRNYDSYDVTVSKYDSAAIRERCDKLLPSLVGAPVIRESVGLRPHRDPVRVETEIMNSAKGSLKVVHNYGHGGYGVTTAPGTAIFCCKLVDDAMKSNSKL